MKLNLLFKKTKTACVALFAAATLAVTSPVADGAVITLVPSSQTTGVGGTAVVDLNISGLGDFTAPSLGAWRVQIFYNPAIVGIALANITFGTELGVSDTFFSTVTPGLIDLDELSFELPFTLDGSQPDSFTLAKMTFTGLTIGTTDLEFGIIQLSDADGFALALTSATEGSITVQAASVPEGSAALPAAIVWVVLMCIGIRLQRSRRLPVPVRM